MLTAWRALEFPSEPWVQSAATPEALLQRVRDVVAAQLEEPDASVLPTRMVSQSADSALGVLVHPDQADDSVRDVEFRLHMRRDGDRLARHRRGPPRTLPPRRRGRRPVRVTGVTPITKGNE